MKGLAGNTNLSLKKLDSACYVRVVGACIMKQD